MKAGIYQTPNGNLIYVRKDRTIAATTLSPSSWPGTKVTTKANGACVVIEQTEYVCRRVSDVPNGCTDPQKALTDYQAAGAKQALDAGYALNPGPRVAADELQDPYKAFGNGFHPKANEPRATGMPATLGMGYGKDIERETEKPRRMGMGYGKDIERETEKPRRMVMAAGNPSLLRLLYSDFADLEARAGVHMLLTGAGKRGFHAGGVVKNASLSKDEVAVIVSRGHWAGGPMSSNLDRTEEKMVRLADSFNIGAKGVAGFAKAATDTTWAFDTAMRANGYRPCHAQSARKHRKQGHTVIADGARPGAYWWRAPFMERVRRSLAANTHIG